MASCLFLRPFWLILAYVICLFMMLTYVNFSYKAIGCNISSKVFGA